MLVFNRFWRAKQSVNFVVNKAKQLLCLVILTFVSGVANAQNEATTDSQSIALQNSILANDNKRHFDGSTSANVPDSSTLKLVGKGRFKFAFWSIYDAELYTPSGLYRDNDNVVRNLPLYLKLTYLRAIEKQDLVDNTFDQWRKQKLNPDDMAEFRDVLLGIWPDVKESDSLAIEVTASGSQFYFNNKAIGPALSKQFGEFFSGIWLAKNSTEPTLRQQLIGSQQNESN